MIHGVVERTQLVVLLAAHDFVRADDLLPDAHLVLRRRHRSSHVVTPQLSRGSIRNNRRMKEPTEQAKVDLIADDRRGIGMDEPRATDQHRERQYAVRRDAPFVLPILEDDVAPDVVERTARRDSSAEPPIEDPLHRAEHCLAPAILQEIGGLVGSQGEPL